jgi:hypothetical protein
MVDARCKRETTVANLERFRGPEGGITVPQVLDSDTFFLAGSLSRSSPR